MAVLHGIGSSAASFAPLLTRLGREARRVIAPELPAHGASAAPRERLTPDALFASVAHALDTLVDEPSIVFGNSLGGALALRYALERPERVRGLVLASPAGARMSDDEWRELVRAFDLGSPADARRLLARLYHRPRWFVPWMAGGVQATFERPAIRELLASARPDDLASPEQVSSLEAPTLLLWGRSERLLPASNLDWFRRHLPAHAIIEEPHGFGHCAHLDDPRALARRIVAFARESPAARPVGARRA
jgi:pimeloyl-ACP methyl ester carboxylesterase